MGASSVTTRAAGLEDQSPIALLNILLEASIGPTSNKGRIIGQGNFAEAKAMLKKAGNAIARSQRIVLHFSKCFFSALSICLPFLLFGRVGYLSNYTSKAKSHFNLPTPGANCKRRRNRPHRIAPDASTTVGVTIEPRFAGTREAGAEGLH